MDPVTIIVTALVAGAAAGLKPTAEQAIKDAYATVKTLIQRKYEISSIEFLEQKPDSELERKSLAEDLTGVGADKDKELLDKAKSLLDAVKTYDHLAAATLKINFEEIEAAYFKLANASAEGDITIGVKKGTFSSGIDMEGLTAGATGKK